jgi:uncharacterized protein YabN with tetrapyrrole methylase and pyrophosphatase domain
MTPSEYIEAAYNTNKKGWSDIDISKHEDLIHGAIGACTESSELLDAVKKFVIYEKPIDIVNIKEEVGDVLWYLALICKWSGFSFEEAMEVNIQKLKTRYPNKFTNDAALNRNIEMERLILEQ